MSNTNTVRLTDGREVCLSYGVPVAAFVPGRGYLKTDARYSVTTSRHANAFCGGGRDAGTVIPDAEFRALVAPVGQ